MRTGPIPAVLALVATLSGCAETKPASTSADDVARRCPVTLPGADLQFGDGGFNHGNDSLGVALWPGGRLVAGRLPGGGSNAQTNPDGSISAKLGWWRASEG